MRFCSPKRLCLALLLLSVAAGGVRGQWRIVARNVVGSNFDGLGGCVIHSTNGVLWVGGHSVAFSTDTGKTWTNIGVPIQIGGGTGDLTDLAFANMDTGVVEEFVTGGGLLLTTNQGGTWNNILRSPFGVGIAYERTKPILHFLGQFPPDMCNTSDNGNTWTYGSIVPSAQYADQANAFAIANDGTMYAVSGYKSLDCHLYLSLDSAHTWQPTAPLLQWDSYSLSTDSCDESRLYLVNEQYVDWATPHVSQILVSSDRGASWASTISQPTLFFSGSFTSAPHSQYAGTINNGILRLTDQGVTWNSIGGPNCPVDCRNLCAINDNIIFVFDAEDNLWATFNSGGDSILESSFIATFSASPSTLFVTDTISCDSLTRSVIFSRTGCSPPSVTSYSVIGTDSESFEASNFNSDSISITLNRIKLGNNLAQLVLLLDNGASDTVTLSGYVGSLTSVLTLSTQSVQTDTLGATIAVPITLNGLERAENVDLVMHYDGSVDYLGSFSPSGVQLDVPDEQWAGRSELSITGATSGAVMGYAKFNVFNDSNEAAHATFDSVNILTQTSACEYSMPAPDTSTITTLSGCAIPILSQLIHLGIDPVLSIVPNPANGNVWISSNADLGAVTIEIYDMLGTEQSEVSGQINANEPMELQLPERSGVFNILVHSLSGTRTLRVVRQN